MCGIAGILTVRDDLDVAGTLNRMLDSLRHRGPDGEGTEVIALPQGFRLGLAHARLAIMDLSPTGDQPMQDAASGSWLIQNGEIYNHRQVREQLSPQAYRSTGDTETILKGWVERGAALLPLLRGMFALAVYDGRRNQFWLVRDRLGVKPLYVSQVGAETYLFASEVRALLASGLIGTRMNGAALESYLAFGSVMAPWTMLEDVESILPGECWCFNLNRPAPPLQPTRTRYWQSAFVERSAPAMTRAEALEQLRPVIREACSLRMVADVPVGVFLSGGIDSSSVVATLSHAGQQVHTFSVVFDESAFDESAHARSVARHFGTRHTELRLQARRVLDAFQDAVHAYDQPSVDGLNTYFISRATREAGLKVALSGIGGDELFAGYPTFRWQQWLDGRWSRSAARLLHGALRLIRAGQPRTARLGALLGATGSRLEQYAICRQVLGIETRRRLGAGDHLVPLEENFAASLADAVRRCDPVNSYSCLELSLYLANTLLRDSDQMSMSHALELREPLLDHVLVETVARIPGRLKLQRGQGGTTKGLLVDALPTALPREATHRAKMGFVFPWERWLRQELKPVISEALGDATSIQTAGLDGRAIETLWQGYLNHQPGIRYSDILCLVHLLVWIKRHAVHPAQGQPHLETALSGR